MTEDGHVGSRCRSAALSNRTCAVATTCPAATHSHLDAVIPFAAAFDSAVDLEQNLVMLESDFSDLNLVAGARRRTQLFANLLPLFGVVLTGRLKRQRFFRSRQ